MSCSRLRENAKRVDLESTLGFSWFAPLAREAAAEDHERAGENQKDAREEARGAGEGARTDYDRLGRARAWPRELRQQQALLVGEIADIDGGN